MLKTSVPAEVSCRKEGYGIKSATQSSEEATIHKGRRWYSFKRRYFVLYEDSLKYFTDHTLKNEKGSILLTNGQALQAQVFEANSVEGGQVAHKQFGVTHLLEVVADSRIFVMGLLSEEEAYSWRRLLKAGGLSRDTTQPLLYCCRAPDDFSISNPVSTSPLRPEELIGSHRSSTGRGLSLDTGSPAQPPTEEQRQQRQGPDGRAQSMCLSDSEWSRKEWQGAAPAIPPPNHRHSTAVPTDNSHASSYSYSTAMGMGFTAPLRWMASAMEEITSPNSKGSTSRRGTVETLASVSTAGTMSTMSNLALSVDLQNRQLPARQGKLMKEGRWVKSWHERYFVLEGRTLTYFADPDVKNLKGGMRIDNASVVLIDEPMPPGIRTYQQRFTIHTPERTLRLAAKDADEAMHWKEAVESALCSHAPLGK